MRPDLAWRQMAAVWTFNGRQPRSAKCLKLASNYVYGPNAVPELDKSNQGPIIDLSSASPYVVAGLEMLLRDAKLRATGWDRRWLLIRTEESPAAGRHIAGLEASQRSTAAPQIPSKILEILQPL
jgi:hypothetical protein